MLEIHRDYTGHKIQLGGIRSGGLVTVYLANFKRALKLKNSQVLFSSLFCNIYKKGQLKKTQNHPKVALGKNQQ